MSDCENYTVDSNGFRSDETVGLAKFIIVLMEPRKSQSNLVWFDVKNGIFDTKHLSLGQSIGLNVQAINSMK